MGREIRSKYVPFDKEEWLKDPEIRAEYEKHKSIWDLKFDLIKARLKAKMSQADVAKIVGCKAPSVSRFESVSGRIPNIDTIIAYAKAVGLKELRIKIK